MERPDHMEPVSCGCGTTVFVEKFSAAHTSVQWPARTVCPQLVHEQTPGGWNPTCPSLRRAIDDACESGRIGETLRHDPPPVRFSRVDAGDH